MGIFSSKTKDGERSVNFMSATKIGAINEGLAINTTLQDNCLHIACRLNKEMTAILSYNKIVSVELLTDKEIIEKSKSAVGRAVVGGLLLGPLGAAVGAVSGTGNSKKVQVKSYIVITYTVHQEELNTIAFEVVGASIGWAKFLDELKEKCKITSETSVEL